MNGMMLAVLAGLAAMMMGGKKSSAVAPASLPAGPAPKTGPKPVVVDVPPEDGEEEAVSQAAQAASSAPASAAPSDATYQVDPVPAVAAAKKSAQKVADHVRNRAGKYDRALVAAWQTAAGLKPDGLYGPKTVAALRALGAKNVLGPLFKGKA